MTKAYSKCFVEFNHPMYGYNKQDKNEVITVAINEEIRPCVRWKTSKYLRIDHGTYINYVRKDVPEDQLNCNPIKCLNTGTLYLQPITNKVKATYKVRSHAENFALGFNQIYLKLPKAGSYTLKVTVSDFLDEAQTDAYVYTYTFNAGAPGEYLRTIDFTDTEVMTQLGNGWNVGDKGIVIAYEVSYNGTDVNDVLLDPIGLSSAYILDERSELRKFSNVFLSCLTSFTHNVSVPATDARCFGRQYDPDSIEITKDITATTTSCNDYWLNPLQEMTKTMTSGIPVTDTFNVEEVIIDGKCYGTFFIPDLYFGDCNTITISSDRCACTYLSNVPVSAGTALEDDEFIALTQEHYGVDRGTILVNPMYIGEKLLVTYNGERDVELIVANDKRLNRTHFRVTQKVVNTRGIEEYYVFNNVLITENSREFGTDGEITLSLSFTVSRDDNGNFYEIRRNMEDIA